MVLLQIKQQQATTTDFNAEFITRLIPKLDWSTVCASAAQVKKSMMSELKALILTLISNIFWPQLGSENELPAAIPDIYAEDTEFLQKLHHVLLEVDIVEGNLECPETGRIFPITEGIPNMLLNEDEV